ncbi:MAG: NUDIX domain-containing protein [Nocardioides sp.]
MVRLAVKLLLMDADDQLLLIHSKDPRTAAKYWYPVGGGVELGESLQDAAAREAYEETGLTGLPAGDHVWRRDHTYEFNGRVFEVHEEWLLHRVEHFEPAPAELSGDEAQSILGFRWWGEELAEATDTILPPGLGQLVKDLLADGVPSAPIDISNPPPLHGD